MSAEVLVGLVICLSLFFTFTNGFQDGSSVTACAIGSRAMSPVKAVIFVAIVEFCGAIFGGSAVAISMKSITTWPGRPDLLPVLASALCAAILWNYATKLLRLPSSSTHALIGGILGALFAAGGGKYICWGQAQPILHATGVWKVIISLFFSPLIGFIAGYLIFAVLVFLLVRATSRINKTFKELQWVSVGLVAFGHGANDPQKSMGIIMLALHASGMLDGDIIPLWVRLATGVAMALGILSMAPGIIKRVGTGIYKLRTFHGFAAELATASVVLVGSYNGGPVSTAQIISSSVMGVGSAAGFRKVRWLVAKDMLLAWFLTIPCAVMISFVIFKLVFQWIRVG